MLVLLTDDEEAVLAALRSMEACNPVLRAQSRATLEYYTGYVRHYEQWELVCILPLTCKSAVFEISCAITVFIAHLCADYRINAAFVENLRTFDISCTLSGNMLSCESASTILPGRTTCQTAADDDPFPCKIKAV